MFKDSLSFLFAGEFECFHQEWYTQSVLRYKKRNLRFGFVCLIRFRAVSVSRAPDVPISALDRILTFPRFLHFM